MSGCTLFPEGNWHDCCVVHDQAYTIGGGYRKKMEADIELMRCVAEKMHPYIAMIMFIGVRLFGGPHWPHKFRWGKGMRYCNSFTYSKQELGETK